MKHPLLLATLILASNNLYAVTNYDIVQIGLTDEWHTRSDGYRINYIDSLTDTGQVLGSAARYNGSNNAGRSIWSHSGDTTVQIGLTDTGHTRSLDGYQTNTLMGSNQAGQAAGYANRYNGITDQGISSWFYNGNSSVRIGLIDTEHTRSTNGYQRNYVTDINESGLVVGSAARFINNMELGKSAWLYNGNTTTKIGLTDAEHTRSTDNYQYNHMINSDSLNQAGHVIGYAARFNGGVDIGASAWLYNGNTTVKIGLTDAEHTSSTDGHQRNYVRLLNQAGQVIGEAYRYNGNTQTGTSAWLYNGNTTIQIGLTDAEHTRSIDNYQSNRTRKINQAGHISGYAYRYNGSSSAGAGQSVWLYNGNRTIKIGLTDEEHTRSDGYQSNSSRGELSLNEAGQVAGQASRYNGDEYIGQSAWLYNGNTTMQIGLVDAAHTSDLNGFQLNYARHLNEAGQVTGEASRYNGANISGQSAWLYNGNTTMQIGLTDAIHTRSTDGFQSNSVRYLNEAGQVAGIASRFEGNTDMGQSAWLFDGLLNQTTELTFSERSDGYAFSVVNYLGDDGLVLGSYRLYDSEDIDLGSHAFVYTLDEGFYDLGALIYGELSEYGWSSLSAAINANGIGHIVGYGWLSDNSEGIYLASPSAVPVPAAVWLFATGLIGLVGVAKRK